jgi:2-oxoisovalerate dehydrogenase E1 component
MAQWQGKPSGFTKGRDRSFHFGTQEYKIIGMISHLGPQLALADGIALADVYRAKKSTLGIYRRGRYQRRRFSRGPQHSVGLEITCIFLIENNGYALSTPKANNITAVSWLIKP